MNKYLTEFIGTFFLMLVFGCTGIPRGEGLIPPLAVGCVLTVMVYAGFHLSGAHYNPAVTLAAWVRGRCPKADVVPYLAAQVLAAMAAASAIRFFREGSTVVATTYETPKLVLAEFLFTFALAYVYLNVTTAKGNRGNSFYGVAIGLTVLTGALSVGEISGGVFNPAIEVGFCILGRALWSSLWVYLLANFFGGALAAITFRALNPTDLSEA